MSIQSNINEAIGSIAASAALNVHRKEAIKNKEVKMAKEAKKEEQKAAKQEEMPKGKLQEQLPDPMENILNQLRENQKSLQSINKTLADSQEQAEKRKKSVQQTIRRAMKRIEERRQNQQGLNEHIDGVKNGTLKLKLKLKGDKNEEQSGQ